MPTADDNKRNLFGLALSIKRGEEPRKGKSKEVLDIVDNMSEDEISKMASKPKEEKITNEATTSVSSGSYETPFPITKRDMKQLEKLKENKMNKKVKAFINLCETLTKKALIQLEVYNQTGGEKAKETSTKNTKNQKVYDSDAAKATNTNASETGKESKKQTGASMKKVDDSLKNNFKEAKVEDTNKSKLQNDDQRIEAHANGLEDLTYDNISPEKQKQNTEYIKNPQQTENNPNIEEKELDVAQQAIDDAKARKDSSFGDMFDANYNVFGSDVEAKPEESKEKKEIAFENTIKRLKFKKIFENDNDVLKRVSKLPKTIRENNKVFEMTDGNNTYKIRWEGHHSNGIAIILEHQNKVESKKAYDRYMMLSEYNTQASNTETSKLNEHNIFKDMINQSRDLSK